LARKRRWGNGQFPSNAIEIARLERDEAERQAQLTAIAAAEARAEAALSNGQRAIRDLKQWLEEDQNAKRKEPGGRLSNRLNELFKDALAWSAAERENLATLAEAIYGYLDWEAGRKSRNAKRKFNNCGKFSVTIEFPV
jgi:hypothetical protein